MSEPDASRRPRRAWVWASALGALAVVVPVLALLVHDGPAEGPDDGDGTSVALSAGDPPAPSPSSTAAPTPSAAPSEDVSRAAPRALLFGDSYFVGAAYTDETNSMARLAANRLGWNAEVAGASGVGFVHALPEFGLPNYAGLIDNGAFDVGARQWVVIEGGNNDVYESLDEVERAARKVVRTAQRRFPGATVALMGPMDADGDFTETSPVVRVLKRAAGKRGVAFINAKRWMVGHYDLIGPDGSHPFPKGHRIAGRKLAKALRALGA